MNERIKELLNDAEKSVSFLSNSNESKHQIAMQRFAELIVKECATIINDIPSAPQGSWSDGYYEGCTDSAKQIKQHFGVKE